MIICPEISNMKKNPYRCTLFQAYRYMEIWNFEEKTSE